ncbi:hypothetical protein [Ensifer adhaerens]|uniref:hypothetical protein n=1 Tax=Ensifer adhaerens TaxID=106592 RepID=UPI001C4E1823|nr:hypothetical protein [Ensifer adhaerens]MBW0365838.1 hypothetical protein [Ensifer adhaerens]UCM20257.1 hypothetical protein LDL63_01225 [Ensifer adhaerens]
MKIAALSAGLTLLVIASFNPIAGTQLYIYVDHNPNVGDDARAALANQMRLQRDAWIAAGRSDRDIYYLPGDISNDEQQGQRRSVVAELAKAGDPEILSAMNALLQSFKFSLNLPSTNIPDFGAAILANLDARVSHLEATRRAGDRLVVLSTWRGAPQNGTWALNTTRFGSNWIQVGGQAQIASDAARVQSLDIVHYPGLQPSVSFLVRSQDAARLLQDRPTAFLTEDQFTKCRDQSGLSVPVTREGSPSSIGNMRTGKFLTDGISFVQVRLALPTSGPNFLCIEFPSLSKVETKLEDPLSIGVRQLELNASPAITNLLTALVGEEFLPSDGQLSASPLVAAKNPAGGGPSVTVMEAGVFKGQFDVAVLPSAEPALNTLWNFSVAQKETSTFKLDLLDYLEEPKERLVNQPGNYDDAHDCDAMAIVTASRHHGDGEICRNVLKWSEDRLVLRVPPLEEIEKLPVPQRQALRSILLLAATATWSNFDERSRPTAITRDVYAATPETSEAVGWSPDDTPVWKQLLASLLGAAPARQASNATNGVRPELLMTGLSFVAIAAAIGLARPVFLLLVRKNFSEEAIG